MMSQYLKEYQFLYRILSSHIIYIDNQFSKI